MNTRHDVAALVVLVPHPVYAWMGWVQILSPGEASGPRVRPLTAEAHAPEV